ncbi:hypothetical protein SteCoe_35648 [Stentor coeruleus]|uniref:Uncharacterized protein n=1 Tax=Stentor coeruleus TaxID=5963 RepID=A0A1R2ARY2_9CILI|nr:hypothetical protein SteCoe_35648 [Stentor coeruleus]
MLGLHFSPFSDQLAIKFIKIEKEIVDISISRRILGSLSGGTIEKNWKILLEGGLMEARNGKIDLARHILQSLVYHCGSFGAVYLEAIKFEEKWGSNLQFALDLCEKGLSRNQRYGPLWFSTLRILEKLHSHGSNSVEIRKKQESLLSDAEQYLSKELLWKLYLDYALFLDKKNRLQDSRRYLKESVISAPDNLRWKAWIAGSRVELHAGNNDIAFKLLQNSLDEVPSKQKPLVFVEISQAHELLNNIPKAREFMTQACEKSKQDWKIYLERINLEMRCGCFAKGLEIAKEAVSKYFSTGRLWASLIQLFHSDKESISKGLHFKAFLLAIQEVPKSGEVWCEGARLRMNPFTKYYDLNKAEEYLNYAIQFTPQYGDSFIEMLRVYMLKGELHKFHDLKKICINADPNYGMLWFYCKNSPLEGAKDVWKRAKSIMVNEMCRMKGLYENPRYQEQWVELMWTGLCEAIWSFTRNGTLDFNSRAKLIYGSEGLIL